MRYVVYAIPLPYSIEKYRLGQLYMVARATVEATTSKSADGFEVLKNEPYKRTLPSGKEEEGIYTFKIMHLSRMVPKAIAAFIPKKGLKMEETCYNAFPHTITTYHNPGYPDKLAMSVETWVYPAEKNAKYSKTAFTLPEEVRASIPASFTLEKKGKDEKKADLKAVKEQQAIDGMNRLEFVEAKGGVIERIYCDVSTPLAIDKKKEAREKRNAKKDGREFTPTDPEAQKADIKRISAENGGEHCIVYKILKIHTAFPGEKLIEGFLARKMERVFTETHKKSCLWWDQWKNMTPEDIKKVEEDAAATLKTYLENKAAGGESTTESVVDDEDLIVEEGDTGAGGDEGLAE